MNRTQMNELSYCGLFGEDKTIFVSLDINKPEVEVH
jgi:hypothetical protein